MRAAIDARLKYYRPGGIAEYTRHLVRALAELDTETQYTVIHHLRDAETLAPGPNFHRVSTLTPSHHRLERWLLTQLFEALQHGLLVGCGIGGTGADEQDHHLLGTQLLGHSSERTQQPQHQHKCMSHP